MAKSIITGGRCRACGRLLKVYELGVSTDIIVRRCIKRTLQVRVSAKIRSVTIYNTISNRLSTVSVKTAAVNLNDQFITGGRIVADLLGKHN